MPRLSDRKLYDIAEEIADLKEREKKLRERIQKKEQSVMDELINRGTKALEHDGVRINIVQSEIVEWNRDMLAEALPSKYLKKIQHWVIDKAQLQSLMLEGKIDAADVQDCALITPRKPYIRISRAAQ